MQDFESKPAWFDGKFVALKDANLNIRTHALQYGTAYFGGMRAYYNEGKKNLYLLRLEDHHARLAQSGRILRMHWNMPFSEFRDITVKLLKDGGWRENCYLRPFIYKSELSLSPRLHNVEDKFALYAIPLNDYLDTTRGMRAAVSSWTRLSDNQIPARAKATGGYINSALAKSEALENGFDEAIFLDHRGFVSEGSAENIFLVRGGKLITPGTSSSILEGITRRTVIEIAADLGIETIERDISRTELYVADEVFFTGTGAQIAWIESIDRREIGEGKIGPITEKLRSTFFAYASGELPQYMKWLTPVY
ncbi:branched-chain amino acid transaminase [Turneriella parva]|uniref:Branched-chain-amino-acid aminotransferase n=1 Tax=Turneriella parva (strain ATCC BAA-1111 / DSM 21527 / NCTC 11395 / H) TaxID=869212 RepID=I4B884_TURPD|nr:branched-chain amino acid transaminase [Turneriella parva]AFM13491.1 branched chain amino acid aminotransferase apoenzyme [Turneriella parva DSM 21527]